MPLSGNARTRSGGLNLSEEKISWQCILSFVDLVLRDSLSESSFDGKVGLVLTPKILLLPCRRETMHFHNHICNSSNQRTRPVEATDRSLIVLMIVLLPLLLMSLGIRLLNGWEVLRHEILFLWIQNYLFIFCVTQLAKNIGERPWTIYSQSGYCPEFC